MTPADEIWCQRHAARIDFSAGRVYVYWGDESESTLECAVACDVHTAITNARNVTNGTVSVSEEY